MLYFWPYAFTSTLPFGPLRAPLGPGPSAHDRSLHYHNFEYILDVPFHGFHAIEAFDRFVAEI